MKVEYDTEVPFHILVPHVTQMAPWQTECFAPVAHLELALTETFTKKDFAQSIRQLTVFCGLSWEWDVLGEWTTRQVQAMMCYFSNDYKRVWADLEAGRLGCEPTRTILEVFQEHARGLRPGTVLFEGQGIHETDMLSVPKTLVSKRIRSTTYVPNVALNFTSRRNGVLLVYRLTTQVWAISAQAVQGLAAINEAWRALEKPEVGEKKMPEGAEKEDQERDLMDSFSPWSHFRASECEILLQPGLTLTVTGERRVKVPVFSKFRIGTREEDMEVRVVFVDVSGEESKKRPRDEEETSP
jgi:hypothetical protein